MTPRRALGRGRLVIVLGALITVAGSVPAWWTVGGLVTPAFAGNGFEGIGILVFLSAVAALALVVLPFTTRERQTPLDRPASYVLLGLVGVAAFVLRLYQLAQDDLLALPNQAPGLWLTGAGLAVFAWGVGELLTERPPAEW